MACFICNQHGHWSRNCPMAVCTFCGENGHSHNVCVARSISKITIEDVPISRTRTNKISSKNLDDILFDNRIVIRQEMKNDVDTWVKNNFTKKGMIDTLDLIEYVCNTVFNPHDQGHLQVIGYIIAKYCDVSDPDVKTFLRQLMTDINDINAFNKIINNFFGTGSFVRNNNIHFRKLTGFCT